MKAEWDDAPLRVREKPNHLGLAVSMIAACTLAVGLAYWAAPELTVQAFEEIKRTASSTLSSQPVTKKKPIEAEQPTVKTSPRVKSPQTLEEFQAMVDNGEPIFFNTEEEALRFLVDVEQYPRASTQSGPSGERQTDFNDGNYEPKNDINTMESRHVTVASYRQNASAQVSRASNSGLNGTSQVTLKWRDARGRESRWPTTYIYRNSQIENDSFCRNYGSGSIDYRTCRKASKEWLNGRCGSGNRVKGEWQRMYCLAANGFRT